MLEHEPRFTGRRWRLGFGAFAGLEKRAVTELQRLVQPSLPYVLETRPAGGLSASPAPPTSTRSRSRGFVRRRLEQRRERWDHANALWAENVPAALEFFRSVSKACKSGMQVTALVEDGLFEERIQPSVSLMAETLWNPNRDVAELLRRSKSPYYFMED